jgi:hypothetical protein
MGNWNCEEAMTHSPTLRRQGLSDAKKYFNWDMKYVSRYTQAEPQEIIFGVF